MRGAAALAAAAVLASPAAAPGQTSLEPAPSYVAARVPDPGSTTLEAMAGRPFESLRLDHAFFSFLDLGLDLDQSSGGFYRLGGHLRGRVVRLGGVEAALRVTVARVEPVARSGFGARAIAPTWDGEAALLVSCEVVPALAFFVEGTLLGETDFAHPHTAGFVELQGGAEWVVLGPFSVVGRYGVLKGERSTARLGSAGLALRF